MAIIADFHREGIKKEPAPILEVSGGYIKIMEKVIKRRDRLIEIPEEPVKIEEYFEKSLLFRMWRSEEARFAGEPHLTEWTHVCEFGGDEISEELTDEYEFAKQLPEFQNVLDRF